MSSDSQASPPPTLRNRRFLALIVVSFLSSFLFAPLSALLPVYVENALARSPLFSGGLRALFLILGGLFAFPAGKLADSLGPKRVYVLGMAGPLLAAFVFLSEDPLLLGGLCVCIGVSFGFNSAGGQSYLLGAVAPAVLGTASAGYFLGNTLGTASGSLFAGPIADQMGYRALGAVAACASVGLGALAAVVLPRMPKGKRTDAGPSRSVHGFVGLLQRPEVRLLLGIRFLPTCYWGTVTLLVPLLIFRHTGTNTSVATYSAVSLGIAAGFQVLTGRVCDRIGRWRPILVAASLVTLSAVGLAVAGDTLAGLYGFGVMAAASAWSLSTTMPGLLKLVARDGEEGRVVGIAHVAWSAGMLCGSLGGGRLIEWGPAAPFGVSVVFCAAAVGCGWRLSRIYREPGPTPAD